MTRHENAGSKGQQAVTGTQGVLSYVKAAAFNARIAAFFVIFMVIQFVVRALLLAQSLGEDSALSMGGIIRSFAAGVVMDIATFVYIAVPLVLYIALLPAKYVGTRVDKYASAVFIFVSSYVLVFTAFSEWYFWDEFTSRFNFIAVDYLVYMREVTGNINESYRMDIILPVIAIISFVCTYVYLRFCVKNSDTPQLKHKLAYGVVFVLFLPELFLLGFDGMKFADSPNRYVRELSKNGIYSLFSAYRHNELSYRDFYYMISDDEADKIVRAKLSDKDVRFLEPSVMSSIVHEYKPAARDSRKNVIFVVMESMSADYMDYFNPKKEGLTPNMDALASKSLFFTNIYATGTRTVRGLEAVSISVPPTPGTSILRMPGNENISSAGLIFNQKGYDTKFIYGGYGYFDNMNYFFEHNGFEIIDRTLFKDDEITFSNIWGVCDENLYDKVIKEADASYSQKKPFYDIVMTTSNHRPFTYPDGKIDIPSHTGRKGGVKYADYAVGKLIEKASKKPWFKDTVFVFVADHTAGSAGKKEINFEKYKIPFIIYAPGFIKPQKVEKLASQIDALPTLLSVLNMNYTSSFYGKDILKSREERAFVGNLEFMGYIKKEKDNSLYYVVLKPKREYAVYRNNLPVNDVTVLNEAVAFEQHAANWRKHLKIDSYLH